MGKPTNTVSIEGNLGTAPKSSTLNSGDRMTEIFVITNTKWTDRETGEVKETSTGFNVTLFKQPAEFVAKYARKGDGVRVCGHLTIDKWIDGEGIEQERLRIKVSGMNDDVRIWGRPIKDQRNDTPVSA